MILHPLSFTVKQPLPHLHLFLLLIVLIFPVQWNSALAFLYFHWVRLPSVRRIPIVRHYPFNSKSFSGNDLFVKMLETPSNSISVWHQSNQCWSRCILSLTPKQAVFTLNVPLLKIGSQNFSASGLTLWLSFRCCHHRTTGTILDVHRALQYHSCKKDIGRKSVLFQHFYCTDFP
jgi:hypothetical protein